MTILKEMNELFFQKREELAAICKKHSIKSMALFGSAAKGTMNDKSDIDLLIDFTDDVDLLDYADNYFSLLHALEHILGRNVDLVTYKSLRNPVLLAEINKYKIELYAA